MNFHIIANRFERLAGIFANPNALHLNYLKLIQRLEKQSKEILK